MQSLSGRSIQLISLLVRHNVHASSYFSVEKGHMFDWSCVWMIYWLWLPQKRKCHLQVILWYIFFKTWVFSECKEVSSLAMSQSAVFGYGNQLSGYDLEPSNKKRLIKEIKEKIMQQCKDFLGKLSVFIKELVALYQQQLQFCQHLCNIGPYRDNNL